MKKLLLAALVFVFVPRLHAQIIVPAGLRLPLADTTQRQPLLAAIDTLLAQVKHDRLSPALLAGRDTSLTREILVSLKGMEDNTADSTTGFYKPQLINCFPIAAQQYQITLAYNGAKSGQAPALRALITLIAVMDSGHIRFALPIDYRTADWQLKKIGRITYRYADHIDLRAAKAFDENNTRIAGKLGLVPASFDFYLLNNYQEILQLVGYTFDATANGRYRDGYGPTDHTIFSVMHSEDFSHDLVHFYIAQVRTQPRNVPAEEGLAYTWGNAYYTDAQGHVITQPTLVRALKTWLAAHPDTDLLDLFLKNPRSFFDVAKEPQVKTVIASVICDEIERSKGVEGVKTLVNCGRGDDHYFAVIDTLVGINKTNFNARVQALLTTYRK